MEGSSKWDYVRVMSERYQNGCRKEKRLILDELEKNLKVHRKSAVRAFWFSHSTFCVHTEQEITRRHRRFSMKETRVFARMSTLI